MRRAVCALAFAVAIAIAWAAPARAFVPPPVERLNRDVRSIARHLPAASALDVLDLSTGYGASFNAGQSMPAASTIKLPVMVEVFAQLQAGRFDLHRRVTLLASDKDYGSGELCDAPAGTAYPVSVLLEKMIDISDNTATNMLIRLIGRQSINRQMGALGLRRTHLTGDVRTDGWAIRETLRTSPADLVRLLALMARGQLIDRWSSNEMIAILEADQYNTLIPAPLPSNVTIAHKTGSLFDTLNDAGIVFAGDAPYVIVVMTTALPSQDLGRAFIHTVSRLAYTDELRLARWREEMGIPSTFEQPESDDAQAGATPDLRYWDETPAAPPTR